MNRIGVASLALLALLAAQASAAAEPDADARRMPRLEVPAGMKPLPGYAGGANEMDQYATTPVPTAPWPDAYGFSCAWNCEHFAVVQDPASPGATPAVLRLEYEGDDAPLFGVGQFGDAPASDRMCWSFAFHPNAEWQQDGVKVGGFWLQKASHNHYLDVLGGIGPTTCKPGHGGSCEIHFGLIWNPAADGLPNTYSNGKVRSSAQLAGATTWGALGMDPFDGRWHAAQACVALGTPGGADGRLQLWLDGRSVIDLSGVRIVRPIGDHQDMQARGDALVSGIYFNTTPRGASQTKTCKRSPCATLDLDAFRVWTGGAPGG